MYVCLFCKDLAKHFLNPDGGPQRSGWLDIVILRYVNMINAFSWSVGVSPSYFPFLRQIICNIKSLTTAYSCYHRRGNDFSAGEQKLVKNNQANEIQNITLCNIYFSKKGIGLYDVGYIYKLIVSL